MSDFQHIPVNLDDLRQRYRQALEAAGGLVGAERERQELPPDDAWEIEQEWRSDQHSACLIALGETLGSGLDSLQQSLTALAADQATQSIAQSQVQQRIEAVEATLAEVKAQSTQHGLSQEAHATALAGLSQQLTIVQRQQISDAEGLARLETQFANMIQQQQQQSARLTETLERIEQEFPKRPWRKS